MLKRSRHLLQDSAGSNLHTFLFCVTHIYPIMDKLMDFFFADDRENAHIPYSLQFTSARGNEYFCEIDEEYLTDRFNLTGLNSEVQYYTYSLDLIIDVFDLDCDDEMREQIEKSARHLYGLVHARYINSTRGLAKMVSRPIQVLLLKSNLISTSSLPPKVILANNRSPQPRSRNTKKPNLANAPASTATSSPSSPPACPTCPAYNP